MLKPHMVLISILVLTGIGLLDNHQEISLHEFNQIQSIFEENKSFNIITESGQTTLVHIISTESSGEYIVLNVVVMHSQFHNNYLLTLPLKTIKNAIQNNQMQTLLAEQLSSLEES